MKFLLVNFLSTFCLCALALAAAAQASFFKRNTLGFQGHYGSFLTNEPKAAYVRDSYTYFGELYLQRPIAQQLSAGKKHFWGVGVFGGHTGSRQYMGTMAGAFTYVSLPLYRAKMLESRLRLSAGIGWVQKPYDALTNHKNVLIGSPFNGYIHFLWQHLLTIAPGTHLTAGFGFSHLSNGGITLPNLGLNIPALTIGLQHGLAKSTQPVTSFPHINDRKRVFKSFTSVGIKQLPWINSKRYVLNVLQGDMTAPLGVAGRLGGGVLLVHNPSLEVDPATITSNKRKITKVQAGVYAAYEYSIGKVSLPLQLGTYVYNRDDNPRLFEQIGIRYAFLPHWSGQLLLKAHGGKADLLHAGIGYVF